MALKNNRHFKYFLDNFVIKLYETNDIQMN
jgi:hypothetical protein